MSRKTTEDREREIVTSIVRMVDSCEQRTNVIRQNWRENYEIFVNGTPTTDKEDWQTKLSINKFQNSIRTAQSGLINTLVNSPEWYELCPAGYANIRAEKLAKPFKKMMDYYLDGAKFKRHAGTFFLCSLINHGALWVGWKQKLIQNPEFVAYVTRKQTEQEAKRLAPNVVNPEAPGPVSADEMAKELEMAIDSLMAEAQGIAAPMAKPPEKYVRVGALDLRDINAAHYYWDALIQYMEDSKWKAHRYTVNRWELEHDADLGIFDKKKLEEIVMKGPRDNVRSHESVRYQGINPSLTQSADEVELLVYTGPLVIEGKVKKDRYFAVIANNSVLLKDGDYPFWEPPGHMTPIVACAVRQIPYRATGAGIGDSAKQLQKVYDSNWMLVCDTFRFGIAGINIVNHHKLVDKSQLLEGIYPGMTLEVTASPDEVFKHINLTSNLENQSSPVQAALEEAIDQATGVNTLQQGGGNQYSRTSAAETNARLNAGTQNVNIMALDLEQNFLIPTLEKVLARVIQFGLKELSRNPELQALLTEEEYYELTKVGEEEGMDILSMWYRFKVKGFSAAADRNEHLMRMNELLTIVNSGGPLSQLVNLPEFMKEYFKAMQVKDIDKLLIVNDSPLQLITAENQLLLANKMVQPSPEDDHEFHLEQQGPIAQSPYATPAMQQHAMMHEQMLQQIQMQQQMDAEAREGQMQQGPPQIQ